MKIFLTRSYILFLIIFSLVSSPQLIHGQKIEQKVIKGILYSDKTPVEIIISDGKISEIVRLEKENKTPEIYLAPGLIDLQINGYMGVNFGNPDLNINDLRKAVKSLWKEGVTTFLPTLTSADHEKLIKCFAVLSQVFDDPEISPSIPGFHLEGPYISPVKGFRGAHLEKYIRPPDWEEFLQYQKASRNKIILVTVAPEIDGAIPFIRKCTERGLVVSLGHHNGTAEIIRQAADAGARMSTHLGNGCANMINRHLNPLWPQLADSRLTPTLIVDGYHLTPEEVQVFFQVKGPDNTILVSDAVDLAGLEPGEYIKDGRKVVLTPNVVRFPAENVLAGAALPISVCVGNIMRFTQCNLGQAIDMASANPARMFNLNLGEISTGKRADLILFTIEEGKLIIQQTIVAGKVVYSRN
ncbi:MAG: N-acetylglucosamine-6-phosphate deacetylase [Bacteroidales bacterium]|nr:N-acetylglucosamine-6-phosphate deacetylase [Bacteroidales bacterium]